MPATDQATANDADRARRVLRFGLVWIVIPGVVHTMVILLLMHLQFLVAAAEKREAVIDTALEEIDIRDNPVEHLAPDNIKTSAVSDRPLDWKALLQPRETDVQKPDERDLVKMIEATEDEPLQLVKLSVPRDGLSAIPRTGATTSAQNSVAAVVDALTRELAKMLTQRRVLLVWLFDESRSMRESQKQVRERIRKVYAELQGAEAVAPGEAKMVSAVVGFGKDTQALLGNPSANPADVETAIDRIPVDDSGVENVMKATAQVIDKYARTARFQQRVLVIFIATDEPGDDKERVEKVISMAKETRTKVFVLGPQAVFQRSFKWASFPGYDGQKFTTMLAAGPESPDFEITDFRNDVTWGQRPRTVSGFGYWELSRLASATGGVYYVLHGEAGPAYDPERMAPFAPEVDCSSDEYLARCKSNIVRNIIHRLPSRISELEPPGGVSVEDLRNELEQAKRRAEQAVREYSKMIDVLEKGSLANDPHAPARWEANREMAICDAHAQRFSMQQYILTVGDFIRHPDLHPRASGYSIDSGGSRRPPLRGGEAAQKEKARIHKLYEDYIAKYTGTPWAWAARNSRGYSIRTFSISPRFPPPPPSGGSSPPKKAVPKV